MPIELMGDVERDNIGKLVREAWIEYCQEIGDTKPSHLTPYDELPEADKEADRRIGVAVWNRAITVFAAYMQDVEWKRH